jgi:hypothetical protein
MVDNNLIYIYNNNERERERGERKWGEVGEGKGEGKGKEYQQQFVGNLCLRKIPKRHQDFRDSSWTWWLLQANHSMNLFKKKKKKKVRMGGVWEGGGWEHTRNGIRDVKVVVHGVVVTTEEIRIKLK